jgi:hypothetical protein
VRRSFMLRSRACGHRMSSARRDKIVTPVLHNI